ncbi:unnamed protein product [Candida verbasci]|uniref:aminodeoxychorismate synthase n=1 Tax=Candida verbasci TaxID=1227364 RepID=A0A9W4TY14_9ASCO|nr:unnamed protein product [Candida verbasci]
MILLIDSYDSFTNNLANLLEDSTTQKVLTIHNDSFSPDEYEFFYGNYLKLFQFIVIGPGPGHPSLSKDVGIISWLIQKFKLEKDKSKIVPILGICLGFQSLCFEFDNQVEKLIDVKHGQIYDVYPVEESELFPAVKPFGSVRYHSLYVPNTNDKIRPLAFCYEPNDKTANAKEILMAIEVNGFPFYGVQYHPESICSSKGSELVKNFTAVANNYNKEHRQFIFDKAENTSNLLNNHAVHEDYLFKDGKFKSNELKNVYFQKVELDEKIDSIDVCEYFYQKNNNIPNFFLLNSASFPGEWSIIGFPNDECEIITHSVDEYSKVYLSKFGSDIEEALEVDNIWKFVANKIQSKYISRKEIESRVNSSVSLPFYGGYMGIISYEEGQHVIVNKLMSICKDKTPDLKLIYIGRFIAFNHKSKSWFIVSINDTDEIWGDKMAGELSKVTKIDIESIPLTIKELANNNDINFELPDREIYNQQFKQCQDLLHSGDSYELCLTTQSKIQLPSNINSWDIYKILTLRKNPSPYSCFMEFNDCCLISSSPERFLSWKDSDDQQSKLVEFRPIKGTVKNNEDTTLEKATKILKTPKEIGENLMIVDLIRHDVYQFTNDVNVSQLMTVEEYKTVYQLVSVIQGKLQKNNGYSGIDLLHCSLPPGSMTGAPKKRSVEILQEIEEQQVTSIKGGRRGLYSGVVGYWSITDDSDWSVIIRSVFHYKQDLENNENKNLYRIGAGGAITVLSEEEGEWEEMNLKLTTALQAFK